MSQEVVSSLYHNVIDNVIDDVREAFIDEGVEEQVLVELKQLWQQKLLQSKVLDRSVPQSATTTSTPTSNQTGINRVAQRSQQVVSVFQATPAQAAPLDMSSAAATATLALPAMYQHQLLTGGFQLQSTISGGFTAVAVPAGALQAGGMTSVNAPAPLQLQTQPQNLIARTQPQTKPQNLSKKTVPNQVDGCCDTEAEGQACSSKSLSESFSHETSHCNTNKPKLKRKTREIEVIVQLDGNDTSSEDDNDLDEDEDDDGDVETPNQEEEEDPLNSDDDVSGEEQQNLFETDNVIVCQFDKITRSKNRWRFHLKDGIMNINGRDRVFQRANGEADW